MSELRNFAMTSVWRSLLWKEWREHRWKPAIIVGACLLMPAPFALVDVQYYVPGAAMMLMFFAPLAAMFLGAGIAAGEQSRGTIRFLQTLPAPISKPALAKLLWSGMIAATPAIIAALALLCYWLATEAPFELGPPMIAVVASGIAAVSLMTWVAASGVNLSDEVRAGAVGLLVITVVWSAFLLIGYAWTDDLNNAPWPRPLRIAAAGAPASTAGLLDSSIADDELGWPENLVLRSWPFALVMLVSHGALATWFVRRFGRSGPSRSPSGEPAVVVVAPGWLSPPRSRPLTAMIWKQARESAPLALVGGVAIPLLALLVAVMAAGLNDYAVPEVLLNVVPGTWLVVGLFVAVVAGIGVFLDDLRPGLHTFWRSRPINVDQWFTVKLVTGLLVTVVSLTAAPLIIVAILESRQSFEPPLGEPRPLALVWQGLLFHGVAYLVAVLSIILVRHAVYAALLTISVVAAIPIAMSDFVGDLRGEMFCGALAAVAVIAVARLALRNDWGWKG
jgi:hypothetical protein